jgi:hypothetical protein
MQKQKKYVLTVAAAIVVVAVVAFYFAFSMGMIKIHPSWQTTVSANVSVAPSNTPSCNGYVLSLSQPSSASGGLCNWHGGILNVTINGGMFVGTALQVTELNSTTPFSATYNGSVCKEVSAGYYLSSGNYKLSLATGLASSSSSCGNLTISLRSG